MSLDSDEVMGFKLALTELLINGSNAAAGGLGEYLKQVEVMDAQTEPGLLAEIDKHVRHLRQGYQEEARLGSARAARRAELCDDVLRFTSNE